MTKDPEAESPFITKELVPFPDCRNEKVVTSVFSAKRSTTSTVVCSIAVSPPNAPRTVNSTPSERRTVAPAP